MSTTEAGRLPAPGKPDTPSQAGISLQAVIESTRRLDELSCARVVGNVAEAVHAAQKGGQPLGTLTPAAVLVLSDGGIRVLPGAAAPSYTAPERLRGGSGDRRSDVFALGVVLWETLAHERLFDGANPDAIERAVLAHAFRPPSELNANVPAELDAICKKALAREPVDRYQSAKVMAAEIDAVLGDAGYPESNEQIARYVARALVLALGPPPAVPAVSSVSGSATSPVLHPPSKTVPLPSKPARTEILGSLSGVPLPDRPAQTEKPSPPEKPPLAVTAFLGSNAISPAAPGTVTAPDSGLHSAPAAPRSIAPPTPAPVVAPVSAVATDYGPPAMPPPIAGLGAPGTPASPVRTSPQTPTPPVRTSPQPPAPPVLPAHAAAVETRPGLLSPARPVASPPSPNKPSIANAETLATPQLPAHLAVSPPRPQLSMPPGMTVPPTSPGAPLQSSDEDLQSFDEDEHHSDPAEVIALHRAERAESPREGGDVLAGWGWTTGSVQAASDEDVDHLQLTARAGRKRLLLTVGGALAVVVIVTVVAFAFSGSKKPGEQNAPAGVTKPSAQAASSQSLARSSEPAAAAPAVPPEPARPDPTAAPEPAKDESPAAPPPSAGSTDPGSPKAEAVEPARPEPITPEPAKPEPARVAVAPPPRAEPPKSEPARPEPTKVAVAEPPRAPPPRTPPPAPPPPRKLEAKKPPEPKKPPEKAAKRSPPAMAKSTPKPAADKAQPEDPYATPADKPKADPAAAYRTGLQQFARGDTAGALATFKSSQAASPTFAPTWRGLGLVYEKLGNKAQARLAFKRYLQLAPDAGDADQIRERLERLGS